MNVTENEEESRMGKVGKCWRLLSLALAICLGFSIGFNVYKHFSASDSENWQFVFTWGPDVQTIVPYTLVLKMNFTWDNESLFITARVNDDDCYEHETDYYGHDWLGLAFDTDNDGYIHGYGGDRAFVLAAGNWSIDDAFLNLGGQVIGGYSCFVDYPSPYHACTFDKETGYTFNINIPKTKLDIADLKYRRVHVSFTDLVARPPRNFVYVQFRFEG